MVIYLDESYDNTRKWLLISALFNPSHNKFHKAIRRILISNKYLTKEGDIKEVKYIYCNTNRTRRIYEQIIDAFIESDSYFCSNVVKTDDEFDLSRYGKTNEPDKIKRERAYRLFAEHLLSNSMRDRDNAILFMDKMTRCEPKQFRELLIQNFCIAESGYSENRNRPLIRHIQDVVSKAEGYELMGVCDLLQGCILNNLVPINAVKGKKKGALNKNKIRDYLIKKLNVNDLLLTTWTAGGKLINQKIKDKFQIMYIRQQQKKAKKIGSGW